LPGLSSAPFVKSKKIPRNKKASKKIFLVIAQFRPRTGIHGSGDETSGQLQDRLENSRHLKR
jgi:hypothetical protein